jgi:acetyl-CoA acetyltransferase
MAEAVIVDAVRTPIGVWRGKLSGVRPDDMAAHVLRALVERNHLDPAQVEEVIFGCSNQSGEDSRNVARMALLLAGFPSSVAGLTVNRLCGSGLDAVISAARAIKAGEGDIYIAGGVESMTRAPYALSKGDSAFDRGRSFTIRRLAGAFLILRRKIFSRWRTWARLPRIFTSRRGFPASVRMPSP